MSLDASFHNSEISTANRAKHTLASVVALSSRALVAAGSNSQTVSTGASSPASCLLCPAGTYLSGSGDVCDRGPQDDYMPLLHHLMKLTLIKDKEVSCAARVLLAHIRQC